MSYKLRDAQERGVNQSSTGPNGTAAGYLPADQSGFYTLFDVTPAMGAPWYLVVTYNATTHVWNMYLDGVLVGTLTFTKPAWTSTAGALMGTATGSTKTSDDLELFTTYSGALSAGDITNGHTLGQVAYGSP